MSNHADHYLTMNAERIIKCLGDDDQRTLTAYIKSETTRYAERWNQIGKGLGNLGGLLTFGLIVAAVILSIFDGIPRLVQRDHNAAAWKDYAHSAIEARDQARADRGKYLVQIELDQKQIELHKALLNTCADVCGVQK